VRRGGSLLPLALALLLAGVAGFAPLLARAGEAVDVEVRTVPWRTQTGRLEREHPVGQGFRPSWNGLDQLDVGLVCLGDSSGAGLELVLREGGPAGRELRRAPLEPGAPTAGRGWGSFVFEPVEDSAGRELWFELRVQGESRRSPWSPWLRYHGQPGVDTPWGDRVLRGPLFEGLVADESPAGREHPAHGHLIAPNLAALAFACERLEPAAGEVRLELWPEEADPERTPPLRSATLGPEEAALGGWAVFAFEPVRESRHGRYRFRLRAPESTRLVGFEAGPCVKSFHGGTAAEPPLLGASRGGRVQLDRSLVFRAHARPSMAQVLGRIRERAGWKLVGAALFWVLAVAVALRLFLPR